MGGEELRDEVDLLRKMEVYRIKRWTRVLSEG